jgi:hypothetical protein
MYVCILNVRMYVCMYVPFSAIIQFFSRTPKSPGSYPRLGMTALSRWQSKLQLSNEKRIGRKGEKHRLSHSEIRDGVQGK